MVDAFEVNEHGENIPVTPSKDILKPTSVIIVVDPDTKTIWLWKGSEAVVRKKFIGARVATKLRSEYGFNYTVKPTDEGEEKPQFFAALTGSSASAPVKKVIKPSTTTTTTTTTVTTTTKSTAKPAPKPTPKPAPQPTTTTTTRPAPQPTTTASTARPAPRPAPTTTASTARPAPRPAPQPTTATSRPTPQPAGTSAPVVPQPSTQMTASEVQAIIQELQALEPPKGYKKELVVINNDLFTVAEHKIKFFTTEKVEKRLERVKNPPEGTFLAEGFIPRVIIKNGKVIAIEFLKGTPDAILSPIKSEMKERLSDLITFFKSESEEPQPEPKGKPKKKLVPK